jgi:hypothetical protein
MERGRGEGEERGEGVYTGMHTSPAISNGIPSGWSVGSRSMMSMARSSLHTPPICCNKK